MSAGSLSLDDSGAAPSGRARLVYDLLAEIERVSVGRARAHRPDMAQRKDEQHEHDRQRDRKTSDEHPGARGEKVRVPENPEQPRRDAPLGNGGTNEPAAFPPHN